MNNIDQARTKFFPNSKNGEIAKSNQLKSILKRNDDTKKSELKSKTSGNVNIDISEAVKDFSRIKNTVDSAPEIDNSEKISRLKSQIQDGEYEIDYDGLADKLLSAEI